MSSGHSKKRYFSDFIGMLLVSGLSLFLLIYIGFGEAQRTYEQLQYEKLMAQGQIIQSAMEKVLRPGLPLRQYVGFNTLSERILSSDKSISAIIAYDRNRKAVFTSENNLVPLFSSDFRLFHIDGQSDLADRYLRVKLPLSNRFEQIGSLVLIIPKSVITQRIKASFDPLFVTGAALSIVFSLFTAIFRPQLNKKNAPWLQFCLATTFLSMSIIVVVSLIMLYSEGAQAKTRALADTLGYRLADIVSFNLVIKDIVGLDQLFADYQRLNPDIEAAALIVNNKVAIHTNPEQIGQPWVHTKTSYEYIVNLTPTGSIRDIRIAVALPFEIVFQRTTRSIKNFAALFVASAFLAGLFLQCKSR